MGHMKPPEPSQPRSGPSHFGTLELSGYEDQFSERSAQSAIGYLGRKRQSRLESVQNADPRPSRQIDSSLNQRPPTRAVEYLRIRIGQKFRVSRDEGASSESRPEGLVDYRTLTAGEAGRSADINKGIWAYKSVSVEGAGELRRPAIILLTNPLKAESEDNPWLDIVDPDTGYALFHGDNRTAARPAHEAPGNRLLEDSFPLYRTPELRPLAPPILLFRQAEHAGRRKGSREFCGYGIPVRLSILVQKEPRGEGRFANLAVELTLFELGAEDEWFDWSWIDARRDPAVSSKEALRLAPAAWKQWVKDGDSALDVCRRHVFRSRLSSPADQAVLPIAERELLSGVCEHYRVNKHAFEALASLVASRVLGPGCERGWVTKRSGDGGVDFVSRLTLGSETSATRLVVLGQAKCIEPRRSIGGRDLARVVARLQRGWVGVFVTTGVYSRAAQLELYEDKYPLILVNGRRLALELRLILNAEGVTLKELLEREDRWYDDNLQRLDPSRILELGKGLFTHALGPESTEVATPDSGDGARAR